MCDVHFSDDVDESVLAMLTVEIVENETYSIELLTCLSITLINKRMRSFLFLYISLIKRKEKRCVERV